MLCILLDYNGIKLKINSNRKYKNMEAEQYIFWVFNSILFCIIYFSKLEMLYLNVSKHMAYF